MSIEYYSTHCEPPYVFISVHLTSGNLTADLT